MRRHPLAGYFERPLVGGILTLSLVACVATGPAMTASPPGSVDVTITTAAGETTSFEPAVTVVQAGGPIALTFRNGSSWAHNLVFTAGSSATTRTIVDPGASEELLLPPLPPGTYPFVCTIHDGMAGTLVVQSTSAIADPVALP